MVKLIRYLISMSNLTWKCSQLVGFDTGTREFLVFTAFFSLRESADKTKIRFDENGNKALLPSHPKLFDGS